MSPKTRHREGYMGRMFTSVRGGQCVKDLEMKKVPHDLYLGCEARVRGKRVYSRYAAELGVRS